jgi:acid phosphatase
MGFSERSGRKEKMKTASRFVRIVLVAALTLNLNAQTASTHVVSQVSEPPNLGLLKAKLKSYHDCTCTCGCYTKSLDLQAQRAIAFLERSASHKRAGQKLALVLDIDDTSLSTWPEMTPDDFGFISKDWNAWAETSSAPAIPGTLRLFKRAQELGVAVFFITGRADTLRAATEKNLHNAGYDKWDGLTLRAPDQAHEATIAYKSAARAAIVQQGYRIILSVGDQWSDLRGRPAADYSVKLPNPFYYIP